MKDVTKRIKNNIVIKRLKANTPPFFKKVGKVLLSISGAIAVAVGALFALPQDVYSLVPIWMLKSAGISVFLMTLFGAGVTQLATDDKKLVDQQYKEDEEV